MSDGEECSNSDLRKLLEEQGKKFDTILKLMETFNEEVKEVMASQARADLRIAMLTTELTSVKKELYHVVNELRGCNFKLFNFEEKNSEENDLCDRVAALLVDMGISDECSVKGARRLGGKKTEANGTQSDRPILVQMATVEERKLVFEARDKFKDKGLGLGADLSFLQREERRKAHGLKKDLGDLGYDCAVRGGTLLVNGQPLDFHVAQDLVSSKASYVPVNPCSIVQGASLQQSGKNVNKRGPQDSPDTLLQQLKGSKETKKSNTATGRGNRNQGGQNSQNYQNRSPQKNSQRKH